MSKFEIPLLESRLKNASKIQVKKLPQVPSL